MLCCLFCGKKHCVSHCLCSLCVVLVKVSNCNFSPKIYTLCILYYTATCLSSSNLSVPWSLSTFYYATSNTISHCSRVLDSLTPRIFEESIVKTLYFVGLPPEPGIVGDFDPLDDNQSGHGKLVAGSICQSIIIRRVISR